MLGCCGNNGGSTRGVPLLRERSNHMRGEQWYNSEREEKTLKGYLCLCSQITCGDEVKHGSIAKTFIWPENASKSRTTPVQSIDPSLPLLPLHPWLAVLAHCFRPFKERTKDGGNQGRSERGGIGLTLSECGMCKCSAYELLCDSFIS